MREHAETVRASWWFRSGMLAAVLALGLLCGVGCLKSPDGGEIQSWSESDGASAANGAGSAGADRANDSSDASAVLDAESSGSDPADAGVGLGEDGARFAPDHPTDASGSSDVADDKEAVDARNAQHPGACEGDGCTSGCTRDAVDDDVGDGASAPDDTGDATADGETSRCPS